MKIDDYDIWDKTEICLSGVTEKMWISAFPSSKKEFWRFVVEDNLDFCFQFETYELVDYNIHNVDEIYENNSNRIRLLSKKKLTSDCIVREFEIENKSGKRKIFYHAECFWEDGGVPELESFSKLTKFYLQKLTSSTRMISHCWGGHGRSGTFVYTMALLRIGIDKADSILKLIRQQRKGVVETMCQEKFAEDFAEKYLQKYSLSNWNL